MKKLGFIAKALPYLSIVFINTFVDLGHKVLIQDILFQTSTSSVYSVLSAIVNAMIIIPYIVFFTPAGFISDRFAKSHVMRVTALCVPPIALFITCCYFYGWFWAAFVGTLLFATQSAFNSPAKYGYIREAFGSRNLASMNGIVQSLTILAIVAGTFIFSYLYAQFLPAHMTREAIMKAMAPLGILLFVFSSLEYILTRKLEHIAPKDHSSEFSFKQYLNGSSLKKNCRLIFKNPTVFSCIMGLAAFWSINQILLVEYPAYIKMVLPHASIVFSQGMLATGGLGILLGALLGSRLSKDSIELGSIPIATLGLAITLLYLPTITNETGIILTFFAYGIFCGLLMVPLNALIQYHAKKDMLGKVLAGNNYIQNIAMLVSLALCIIVAKMGSPPTTMLWIACSIGVLGAIYTFLRLPQALCRYLLFSTIKKIYRVKVLGFEHIPVRGGVLLLGNHVSFLDWAIVQIGCPRKIRFVMDRAIYEKWYLHFFLKNFGVIPISRGGSKSAISSIQTALEAGEAVALFPEGYLSRNGQIGEFFRGFEKAAEGMHIKIVPFYLHGLWGTKYSYAKNSNNNKDVIVCFGKTMPNTACAADVKKAVTELSIATWNTYANQLCSLQESAIRSLKETGSRNIIAEKELSLTGFEFLAAIFGLKKWIKPHLSQQQNVGILLPASIGCSIANFSVLTSGKTVVNINFTSSDEAIHKAINKAGIQTIITSRLFQTKLENKDLWKIPESANLIYLEDFKASSTLLHKIKYYAMARLFPTWMLLCFFTKCVSAENTAAILFSSGSESTPKGIELSHRNLLANAKQVANVFNIEKHDVLLNSMPPFHAFGLTITTIMPILEGILSACHPDPTDGMGIGKTIFRYQATILCGTSTFYHLYTRNPKLNPLFFESLRTVIAGAEKLSPSVRANFKEKFGLDIYEGYGATETSPVASVNLPNVLNPDDLKVHTYSKPGTVGLPLPGTAFRIVDPNTYEILPHESEGLILIGGPQVMKGYLHDPNKTDTVIHEDENIRWYTTGDKGKIDADGFLVIVDRYARFAKIAGEMVSLSVVENAIEKIIDDKDIELMAVAIPDAKKGEKIVLLYSGEMSVEAIKTLIPQSGLDNIAMPGAVHQVGALPRLGSGKKDFGEAKRVAVVLEQ